MHGDAPNQLLPRMKRRHRLILGWDIFFHGSIALLFVACALIFIQPSEKLHEDRIIVGLNWVPETEHCGLFQAQAAGLYQKAGLAVEIVSGGPEVNLPLLVGSGRMNLALGSSFTTLNMINRGIDAETIASFFQKDPQTLIAHGGQGIGGLEDVRGHRVMIANFSREEFWRFLKARYGFTDDQLQPLDSNPSAFLADKSAVAQGYVTQDEVLIGSRMREPLVSFVLADYGFDNYSQTLFGMRPWINAHRDLVRRFIQATAQGYRDCTLGDPKVAMAPILARNPEHGEILYLFKQKQIRTLQLVTGGDAASLGIGAMTDRRWEHFFRTMAATGLYPADLNWRRAYSLDFIDASNRVMP